MPPEVALLRQEEVGNALVPAGELFPNEVLFRPNSGDEREAVERGTPIRVSAWDSAITSPDQALTFREGKKAWQTWEFPSTAVWDLRSLKPALAVVRDPLKEQRPGAEGHCGIEGLDLKSGGTRPLLREIRSHLARACRRVSSAPPSQ